MDKQTKIKMQNMIARDLSKGLSHDCIKERFLTARMAEDFWEGHFGGSSTLKDIFDNLLANGCIENTNIIAMSSGLHIKLSPTFCLHIVHNGLRIMVNDSMPWIIHPANTKDVVMWVIRQKQKLNLYLQEWEELFKELAKKQKKEHLAFLAIKAIFTESMKDYPQLKYEIVAQRYRARIKVRIPNSNLGVCLDGWWGKYKDTLPKQIESLKALIDVHRTSAIKTYTIYR